jgi:dTDP-4-amino-4,6-dideoxygalactose transaminase
MASAARHGLWIVEDAAQAHGAEYRGRRCGTMGRLGAFSFLSGKESRCLGRSGAWSGATPRSSPRCAGCASTRIAPLFRHRRLQRTAHAIQARLRVKLRRLAQWNERAARLASDIARRWPASRAWSCREASYAKSVYHLFVIPRRAARTLRHRLTSGIATGLTIRYRCTSRMPIAILGSVAGRCARDVRPDPGSGARIRRGDQAPAGLSGRAAVP